MAVQYKNFVEGTLNAAISGTGNQTITVNWATNATVPAAGSLTVSNYMLLVIDPEGANGAPEIVKVTDVAGSGNPYTLTLTERGVGSSSARTHADASKVVAAITAEQIDNFATKDGTTFTGDVTIPDGDLILGSTAVTSTAAELNILDGCTATVSELNIMDGVTATTSELNIMDGVTATTAEINYLDDDDLTAADLTKLAAITSSAAELNLLDGISVIQSSSGSFADNNTSLMTSAAIQDKIEAYGYSTTTIHFASSEPNAGGAGELWIKTS